MWTMPWGSRIVTCAATLVLCACAAPPAARPAWPAGAHGNALHDTYVVAPRQVGLFQLVARHNYQDEVAAPAAPGHYDRRQRALLMSGVQLRYVEQGRRLSADLYIYPAPGGDADHQLRQGMADFRRGMRQVARAGLYTRVGFGPEEQTSLAEGADAWPGRMLPMTLEHDGRVYASRTYLFVHHLYFYKLRMDVPVGDAAAFDRRAARFLRHVVAPVDTISTGSCGYRLRLQVLRAGQPTPAGFSHGVNADGTAMLLAPQAARQDPMAYARRLASEKRIATLRQARHGCVALDYTPPHSTLDRVVMHLHYPAGLFRVAAGGATVADSRRNP